MFANIGISARVFAAGVVLLWAGGPAAAATIDYTVNISATNFIPGSPVDPVTAEFALSFDTAADAAGAAIMNSININNAPASVSFVYNKLNDRLIIGGDNAGANFIHFHTNDFMVFITQFTTSPTFEYFGYTQEDEDTRDTITGSAIVSATPAAVTPIPAALPLFISALGAMGYLGWRRKQAHAA